MKRKVLVSASLRSLYVVETEDSTLLNRRSGMPLVDYMDSVDALAEVEALLGYHFKDRSLLQEALTHSSHGNSNSSYQRLEFLGDAALGLLFTNHIFLIYPKLKPGGLSILRAANVCTEKLARVAVRHNLYHYLRRDATELDDKVREFECAIKEEQDETGYSSSVKAPKVLADVVEAVAAAVYVDCGFDLETLWVVFRGLLEPIITRDTLQLQPVSALFQVCQKRGLEVDFKYWRDDSRTSESKSIASVYVDGELLGSSSSVTKEVAKLNAAKEALRVLLDRSDMDIEETTVDVKDAKQKLHELCCKKRWSKPRYSVDNEEGPAHDRRYFCSVQVETEDGRIKIANGEGKTRVKEAESSAACPIRGKMAYGFASAKLVSHIPCSFASPCNPKLLLFDSVQLSICAG
ncbi:hypothetical protein H6P81_013749 [Aristolochia fimbriata]|uniref:Uncharacterized protein n=1 Tax=Aristolochia fimbriata TaxID=158543 RepID=A0AAV7EGT2_ARIFI|nr:hypothetical protein H6P81_013749 [Aristolochia fimbriata]